MSSEQTPSNIPTTFQIFILGYLAEVHFTKNIGITTSIHIPAFNIKLNGYVHISELITEATDRVQYSIQSYLETGKKLPIADFYMNVTQRILMLEDKIEWLMNNA